MQSEKRKLSQRAMLTREFIFFTQHLGRVRLIRYKGRRIEAFECKQVSILLF